MTYWGPTDVLVLAPVLVAAFVCSELWLRRVFRRLLKLDDWAAIRRVLRLHNGVLLVVVSALGVHSWLERGQSAGPVAFAALLGIVLVALVLNPELFATTRQIMERYAERSSEGTEPPQAADNPYPSIKALVLEYVRRHDGNVDNVNYDDLTKEVLRYFPDSAWKPSHWAYYRQKIRNGELKVGSAKENLRAGARGGRPVDPEAKRLGDRVLRDTRQAIADAAGDDPILRFRLNRWVFSRLQIDERKLKTLIKSALWDAGQRTCPVCGKAFESIKGLHLHRRNPKLPYSVANCVLVHPECHRVLEKSAGERADDEE